MILRFDKLKLEIIFKFIIYFKINIWQCVLRVCRLQTHWTKTL